MRLYTAAEMRAADEAAERAGIATSTLMDNAGRAVADDVRAHFPLAQTILVLCGPGNNGGDGYVAARDLARTGRSLRVAAWRAPPAGEAALAAHDAWRPFGGVEALTPEALPDLLNGADLVIDALLGSGLGRPLEGGLARVVDELTAAALPVVAVDVPTGVDADRAHPPGPHLRAARTVQLGGAKRACMVHPARAAFGTWTVADIGLPREALEDPALPRLWTARDVARARPRRAPDTHKYRVGTVVVVGGSERYRGAAELACRGAHRAGAGLVTLAARERAADAWPETVLEPISWREADAGADPVRALQELPAARTGAWVIGPGLDDAAVPYLPRLLAIAHGPVVLDAGALRPELRNAVRNHGAVWLTPHHGEAARLLDRATFDIRDDPIGAARSLAEDWNAGVVLKGAGSVLAAADGRCVLSDHGGAELASGGTGDALAGVLGAYLAAPHEDALERAASAAWLHGRAGELAAERFGEGLRASDLLERLPRALRDADDAW